MKSILGYYINQNGVYCSDGSIRDKAPFFDWNDTERTNMLYDMEHNIANLLRLIGLDDKSLEKLNYAEKLYLAPQRLIYFPGKMFAVEAAPAIKAPRLTFYNASQYLNNGADFKNDNPIQHAVEAREIELTVAEAVIKVC